jgi:hypothetical protein
LQSNKTVSSKVSNIINKLGTLDEFTETVRQLNSTLTLTQPNTAFKHPWAKTPVSVGAQGAVILAARIRNAKDKAIRAQYWKAGCLTPLINMLISGTEEDKVHAATMALSALTDDPDTPEIAEEIVQLDGLAILVKWMRLTSAAEGVRMSCARIARNVIANNSQYRSEFVRLGGLKALVSLLDFDRSRTADEQYMQWILERVNDVRDYLDETNGRIDQSVGAKLVSGGVRGKLEKLKSSGDNDIVEDSMDILNLIEHL